MKSIIYFFFAATILLLACKSKDKKKEYTDVAKEELTAINMQYDSAIVKNDTGMLKQIFAEEFSYTTTEGQVRNREQQLNSIASDGLKIEFAKSDQVEIDVYDSTAVVSGRFMGKGIYKDNIIDIKERYLSVWVKRNGAWVLVKEQGTAIQ